MSLKARVVAVRTLEAGERPSYGRLRPLPARSLVATVPIGYADGVPRALFDGGYEVLIGGVRRPLAGMVTMDQIVVDCGDDDSVRPGDEVVLLGRQGDESITADDWAAMLGTISYEVVCGVGPAHAAHRGQPPGRARWLTAATPLEQLRVTASTCTLCPLAKGRTQVVFGVGAPTADLLFVGEGPGREEDLAGEPFVGRSGKLLDRLMWEEVGLTRAECYIANVVKCRPPQNRDPAPEGDRGLPALPGRADRRSSTPASSSRWATSPPSSCSRPPRASASCAARCSNGAGPAWCRRTTRPTCCGRAARPWPRCGPTSSGRSA